MRCLVFIFTLLFAALPVHAAVVFQSAAYGAINDADGGLNSNSVFLPNYYVGEQFSLSSKSTITDIEIYILTNVAIGGVLVTPSDINFVFFDSAYNQVYAQSFTPAQYTESVINPAEDLNSISASFTPFNLDAGDYTVFFYGTNLFISLFDGSVYGKSQFYVNPPSADFPNPLPTSYASGLKLSGLSIAAVPEPENIAMLLLGIAVLAQKVKRRKLS